MNSTQEIPSQDRIAEQEGVVSLSGKTGKQGDCSGILDEVIICIPVFNDWSALVELVRRIDRCAKELGFATTILVINDGSTEPLPASAPEILALGKIELVNLRTNLGHQRAIAVGLTFIRDQRTCSAVVVMDGDGEDAPESIAELAKEFQALEGERAVFAKRSRRVTSITFKALYLLFKVVHRILTGRSVEVGNFSIIPFHQLDRLVIAPDLWSHYAAAVFKSRIPIQKIPIDRGKRISGRSKMNFTSLVVHGLSAVSVFADTVGVRLLVAALVLIGLSFLGLAGGITALLSYDIAVPAWASTAIASLMVILLLVFVMSFFFIFVALYSRNHMPFLPIRDYRYYIAQVLRWDDHA